MKAERGPFDIVCSFNTCSIAKHRRKWEQYSYDSEIPQETSAYARLSCNTHNVRICYNLAAQSVKNRRTLRIDTRGRAEKNASSSCLGVRLDTYEAESVERGRVGEAVGSDEAHAINDHQANYPRCESTGE